MKVTYDPSATSFLINLNQHPCGIFFLLLFSMKKH